MGTKITYKGLGHNPDGDNRINLEKVPRLNSKKELKKALADPSIIFMKVTDHEIFGINRLKYKRKRFLLLEPNPVTFYYSVAYDLLPQIEAAKKQLEKFIDTQPETQRQLHIAYSYIFKVGSIGVVFRFWLWKLS